VRLPKATLAYVVLCLGVAALLVAPAFAQQNDSARVGLPHDWSHHHVIFTDNAPPDIVAHPQLAQQLRNDPRFLAHVIKSHARRHHDHGKSKGRKDKPKIDWSISLGSGSTPLNQYPAKYTFDITAPLIALTNCPNDYVVFPINVPGSSTQPNIAGFNYLYSGGTTGPEGLCNGVTPATPAVTGSTYSAAVYFSYNVNAIGGAVLTSPVISLDGTKIAFVESKSGTAPHFHVLAFKAGDGFLSGSPTSVASPVGITSFVSAQPTAVLTAQATDLSYSSGCTAGNGNSNSSPFVDYTNDVAWVGDDCGNLIKLQHIFTTAAPTADSTFNGGNPFVVCSGHKTTGPVYDFNTGDVLMGCDDGNMYRIIPGTPSVASLNGGGSSTNLTNQGGVSDSPLVDSGNGYVYWTHPDDGLEAYVAQVKDIINFDTVANTVPIGTNNVAPVHAPAFNDAYFSSGVPSNWELFACGFTSPGNAPELYGVSFNVQKTIAAATGDTHGISSTAGAQCSPITEFLGAGGTDRIFFGINSGEVDMFDVTIFDGSQTASSPPESGGTSGIIVDNNSASANASSFYFSTLTGHAAVKLTQSALQ